MIVNLISWQEERRLNYDGCDSSTVSFSDKDYFVSCCLGGRHRCSPKLVIYRKYIFNPNNRFIIVLSDTLERLTNIMLNPIRKNLPCTVGSLDLSPIVLILTLTFFENVIIRIMMKVG